MLNFKSYYIYILTLLAILINLVAGHYYYNHITGQIDEARLLYEQAYRSDTDFNSIFWLCQKIFLTKH